jgi:hypothetical protein
MKIEMFLAESPGLAYQLSKAFDRQLAINGIPRKLALFFVVIAQARKDGSVGV